MATRQNHLAVSVAAALPLASSGVDVNTTQNSFVQSVNMTFMKHGAIKLVLHVDVFPECFRGEVIAAAADLKQCRTFTVARRDKQTIPVYGNRLGNIDSHISVPGMAPEK